MCGICGVVQVRGERRPVLGSDQLDRMIDVMQHRGPNDRGSYTEDGVALGVRRLSIIDVADGHQPFATESGRIQAIQNGELYNHNDLRTALVAKGHGIATRCDTEVIPHLYEEHRDAFPEHLHGMFGVAVWDGIGRRAVIARDRLGIKPVYYAEVGDLLVFGSELKSVLASGLVPIDLDYEAIEAFLYLGFFPSPLTPLRAVRKLQPGHKLIVARGQVKIEKYWEYPAATPVEMSVEESGHRLLEELDRSVEMRLMSDVPLGAMLSGGIDSSVIVALMARHMSKPVKTFSIGFREAGKGNELAPARLVARHFGTDHHELELSFSEQAVDLGELIWHLDEPLADLSSLGFLALSQLAATHVTVALSGQGADELLGGYRKHRAAAIASRWERLPRTLRAASAPALRRAPAFLERAAATLLAPDAVERLLVMSANVDDALRARLARGPLAKLSGTAARRILSERLNGHDLDPLLATLYLDSQLGLVDDMLHYFDRASMARSLEVRVPFLDHKVVEYCATIPGDHKVAGRETKHVLKQAVRGLIPDEIIERPKVGFFNSAVDGWFRAQMQGPTADYLTSGSARYTEMLDRAQVERMLAEHLSSAGSHNSYALLSILMLEIWLSTYLPRAMRSADISTQLPVAV